MKIDRLVSIIMILLDKKRIGAQELAEMFEVSPRTIYRDMDAINMAGIPICSISGVGGGFEIMPNYKIEKNVFTATDLSAILMGLNNLTDIVRGDELINALVKVKSFIPAEKAQDITLKANQLYIDLSPWMGNRHTEEFLAIIKVALQENKLLSFEYADCHGNKTSRTAEPYQLILKSNHWYFQGYCYLRNDFRLFRLCRISNLKISTQTFIPRDYQKPQLEFSDVLKELQIKIKIRVHQSAMDRVYDYCSPEDISKDGDDYFIVQFPFIENGYHYDILLSFGDKCECLEPPHIRAEIKRRLQDILSLYKN